MKRRLEKDWHTDTDLLTDENGCAELYGFRGEYELSRGTEKACMKLSKLSGDVQVMLQTANLRTD